MAKFGGLLRQIAPWLWRKQTMYRCLLGLFQWPRRRRLKSPRPTSDGQRTLPITHETLANFMRLSGKGVGGSRGRNKGVGEFFLGRPWIPKSTWCTPKTQHRYRASRNRPKRDNTQKQTSRTHPGTLLSGKEEGWGGVSKHHPPLGGGRQGVRSPLPLLFNPNMAKISFQSKK